jgi:hypothetical protein
VICGTLAALLGLAVERGEEMNRQTYGHRISFETHGDRQAIIAAVQSAAPDSHLIPYSTHPSYNFFSDWFAATISILLASCFFRILEKICGRLLGLPRREGFSLARPESLKEENRP